jgi:putative salt-induced outer membrane protein YdiY
MKRLLLSLIFTLFVTITVFAQEPAQPKDVYVGSFGGGIALTGGNTDTKNFNLTFNLVRDPKTKNVIKTDALYLRGSQTDVLSVDRTAIKLRDEYTISGRTFAFGQVDYLRDQFKQIIFLWAPVGGLGYKLVNNDRTKFEVDGGAGGYFERNPGKTVSRSASLMTGESFAQKVSSTATFTESFSTIWKTSDFSDSLTNFNVALTTSVAKNLEVKFSFIDSYKNKPATIGIKKNDTAFVTTFVVKY